VKRWIGRSTLVAMATVAIFAAGAASAQAACPILDPLCVVEDVVDDGVGLIDDVVGPIETPVDDVVDPIVDDIVGTVDDLLGGGQVDLPDLPGGTGNGGGSHLAPVPEGGPGTSGSTDRGRSEIVVPGFHQRPELRPFVDPIQLPRPVSDATGSSTAGSGPAGAVLGAVARSLAIVLVLFGLVVAFAAIQDRLDRNDPRLALAPIRSDVETFA